MRPAFSDYKLRILISVFMTKTLWLEHLNLDKKSQRDAGLFRFIWLGKQPN